MPVVTLLCVDNDIHMDPAQPSYNPVPSSNCYVVCKHLRRCHAPPPDPNGGVSMRVEKAMNGGDLGTVAMRRAQQ
ncbi:hypothetical protein E2562_001122 [Oryza meyeriana var. granulata]|uniref:Uncharacterized protein n=1 Tax=Oryza meyeriana var. granulata TaxID=110450 RepID=A0A6G1ED59_9ORYZ|nr:hypothetical protein E2562_001122 [Oryza meyeriana var. granulata]